MQTKAGGLRGGTDRSPMLLPIQLSDQERSDLIAFLESLTGAEETQARR